MAKQNEKGIRLISEAEGDALAEAVEALERERQAEIEKRFEIQGVNLRELQLRMDKDGEPTGLLNNLGNAEVILKKAWALQGLFAYDEVDRRNVLWSDIPEVFWDEEHECWMQTAPPRLDVPRPFSDHDAGIIQLWLQKRGRIPQVTFSTAYQAATVACRANSFHPIRDYLKGLKWDGTPRVQRIFSEMFGVEDTEYSRRVAEIFFVSCVQRIFEPGCKSDYMLILEGDQGFLKSTFFDVLAGQWFSDSMPGDVNSKDAAQHLRGKWIIEVAELSAMRKAESNDMKKFIARRIERYRPAYGREEVEEPRQCIFAGTTNEEGYLKDDTGNRRYLPLAARKRLDKDALVACRDQLWAEAVQMFRDGVTNWPTPEFEEQWMKPQQAERMAEDPWKDILGKWVLGMGKNPKGRTYAKIARDALLIPDDRLNGLVKARIKSAMLQLGYKTQKFGGEMVWVLPSDSEPK